jgi:hypothetical protein
VVHTHEARRQHVHEELRDETDGHRRQSPRRAHGARSLLRRLICGPRCRRSVVADGQRISISRQVLNAVATTADGDLGFTSQLVRTVSASACEAVGSANDASRSGNRSRSTETPSGARPRLVAEPTAADADRGERVIVSGTQRLAFGAHRLR